MEGHRYISFDCIERWNREDSVINPRGFSNSYIPMLNPDSGSEKNEILLFGKTFSLTPGNEDRMERFFDASRTRVIELYEYEIKVPRPRRRGHETPREYSQAHSLRYEVSRFLYYIDYYLRLSTSNPGRHPMSVRAKFKLKTYLESFKSFIHKLDRYFLSEQFLFRSYVYDVTTEHTLPRHQYAYHFIHLNLDFRWLYILINDKLMTEEIIQDFFIDNDSDDSDDFLSLMCELMLTAIIRYSSEECVDVNDNDALMCPCVKEMWVLLFEHLGLQEFWDNIIKILATLLDLKAPNRHKILTKFCKLAKEKLTLMKAKEFTLYFLKDMARLKDHIGFLYNLQMNSATVFIPFYENVKRYLAANPSEESLRRILPVICSTMVDWDPDRLFIVILLVEYFLRKINSNSKFEIRENEWKKKYQEKSVQVLLDEVKHRFHINNSNENENSFGLFLKIIAVHAPVTGRIKPVHTRIFINYDNPNRFKNYSPVSLYHTTSLFLTIALAWDVQRYIKLLHGLMMTRGYTNVSQEEKVIKFRALVTGLLVLAAHGYPTEEVTRDVCSQFRLALSEDNRALISIFTEGLQILIQNRDEYMSAPSIICSFIGKWIRRYVLKCSDTQKGALLAIFNPLVTDLKVGAEWWSEDEMEEIKKLIMGNVYPLVYYCVHINVANSAATFLSYLLRIKNWPVANALYKRYMKDKDAASARFIVSFYNIEKDLIRFACVSGDHEVDVLRCFVNYHILTRPTVLGCRLFSVMKTLPKIIAFNEKFQFDWSAQEDNLSALVGLFGGYATQCSAEEIPSLQKLFNTVFADFGDRCERVLKAPFCESKVENIYYVCAYAVAECFPLCYEKGLQSGLLRTIFDKVYYLTGSQNNYLRMRPNQRRIFEEHLPLLFRGLMQNYNKRCHQLRAFTNDLIWFILPTTSMSSREFYENHACVKILCDAEIGETFAHILLSLFLDVPGIRCTHQNENCVRIFDAINCPSTRDRVFAKCCDTLVTAILGREYPFEMAAVALEYINRCVTNSANCRDSLKKTLQQLDKSEFNKCNNNLKRLTLHLRQACPEDTLQWIPDFRYEMQNPEPETIVID